MQAHIDSYIIANDNGLHISDYFGWKGKLIFDNKKECGEFNITIKYTMHIIQTR